MAFGVVNSRSLEPIFYATVLEIGRLRVREVYGDGLTANTERSVKS